MKLGLGLALPLYKKKGVSSFNPLSYNPALWLKADAGLVTDGAASFAAASSQYLSRADNADLSVGDIDFWWAGWVYLNSVAVDSRALVGKQNGSELEYLLLYEAAVNRFRFAVSSNGGTGAGLSQVDSGSAVSATTWYFVVAYHDSVNNSIGISVNGGSFVTTGHTGGVFNGSTEFRLGARANAGSALYLDGRCDSIAFGKNPVGGIAGLATAIRDSLYNSGNGKRHSDLTVSEKTNWGLVSFYDFEQPGAGLVADSHGSNTLTNNNGVTFAAGIVSGQATADGDPVTTWEDQSGNGNHATQATVSRRLILKLNIQNGLPVVRSDGVDDFLTNAALVLPQPYTIWIVASNSSDNGYYCDSVAGSNGRLVQRINNTTLRLFQGVIQDVTVTSLAVVNCIIVGYDGAGSVLNFNGTETNISPGTSTADGIEIGRSHSAGTYTAMDICEMGLFSGVLSADQRAALVAYARTRWGTP